MLLTPNSEILLMQVEPRNGFHVWITPGGGVNAGESPVDGVLRELREETGCCFENSCEPIWKRRHEFDFDGRRIRQDELFFLFRTPRFEPSISGLEGVERSIFREYRWWDLAALRETRESFAPTRLPEFLDVLLRAGPPHTPIDVGV